MPKKDKYTIGEKAQKTALDLVEFLIAAGYCDKFQKSKQLELAAIKLDLLKILLRLANELKAIPATRCLLLQERLQEIGRMLGGWIKSVK